MSLWLSLTSPAPWNDSTISSTCRTDGPAERVHQSVISGVCIEMHSVFKGLFLSRDLEQHLAHGPAELAGGAGGLDDLRAPSLSALGRRTPVPCSREVARWRASQRDGRRHRARWICRVSRTGAATGASVRVALQLRTPHTPSRVAQAGADLCSDGAQRQRVADADGEQHNPHALGQRRSARLHDRAYEQPAIQARTQPLSGSLLRTVCLYICTVRVLRTAVYRKLYSVGQPLQQPGLRPLAQTCPC